MKNIALLLIFLIPLLTRDTKNDYIRIEYVGDANKSMHVVYISKKRIPWSKRIVTIGYDDFPNDYLVTSNEWLFIKSVFNSTTRKPFEEKDYNGFKITTHENGAYAFNFITRKNSDSLFLRINAYLEKHKKNKDLIQALTNQRLGNVFPDK